MCLIMSCIALVTLVYVMTVTNVVHKSRSELHGKYMAAMAELFAVRVELSDAHTKHRQLIDRIRAYEHTQDWVVGLELTKEKDEHGKS